MSIIGITMDYGPYGFLDYYDPNYLSQASGKLYFTVTIFLELGPKIYSEQYKNSLIPLHLKSCHEIKKKHFW